MEQDKKQKKSSGNSKLIIILAIVLVLVAGGGVGFYMYSSKEKAKVAEEEAKTADPDKTQEEYEKLKEQATIEEDPNDPMNRKIDFTAAQAMNPDVYGWIWIPGTNVDYPILQSETEPDDYSNLG